MINKLVKMWKDLGKPIYVGDRLKSSLIALTFVSIVSMILGIVLIVIDVISKQYIMMIASIAATLAGTACAFCSAVLKNRKIAIIFPILFCVIAPTTYLFTGAAEGMAMLWSLLLPIGLCYFVSVRYGIILSLYYSILFFVAFYTPLQQYTCVYYSDMFRTRFPIVYAGLTVFTIIAMVQYHKAALFEIEHTNKLNEEVATQTKIATDRAIKLEHITEEIVRTLAHVIDAKDKYTNGHSFRVSTYSVALAKKLGWSEEEVADLRWEALLHDIGKIGVPDQVLNFPGKLIPEQFELIKSHTTIGGDILAESSELLGASNTARYHHERYDGTGYPSGLKGKEIPAHARVVSIADAYDAMHSDRVYRKGLPHDVIREELVRGRGTQFDPDYLDVFLSLFESGALDGLGEE